MPDSMAPHPSVKLLNHYGPLLKLRLWFFRFFKFLQLLQVSSASSASELQQDIPT
jgi:hypothetical protein